MVAKNDWPKVIQETPGDPEIPGSYPCVPLKEQVQDWKDWKTGPMTRNTPLVPGGGTVADIYIYIYILRLLRR